MMFFGKTRFPTEKHKSTILDLLKGFIPRNAEVFIEEFLYHFGIS